MIRRVFACLTVALSLAVLIGCSGSSTTSKPATSSGGSTPKGTGTAPVDTATAPPGK
jgi:hypothetical protein